MILVELLVDGELFGMTAAKSMHEAGIEVSKLKDRARKLYPLGEFTTLLDDQEHNQEGFMLDVKKVSKNMKTKHIENKLMGDMEL